MSESVLGLVLASGLMSKAVLAVLFLASVASWAIMGAKVVQFRRVRRESDRFMALYRSSAGPEALYKASRSLGDSPLAALFRLAYDRSAGLAGRSIAGPGEREDLRRALSSADLEQVEDLERHLGFLATVGSVGPFIGLFGTVWGIMDAFQNIGLRGSANLAVVSQPIAEALIATAAGLAAAIPAVIAYNHFVGKIDAVQRQTDRFAEEVAVMLAEEVTA